MLAVYHITHLDNLPSVIAGGVLCGSQGAEAGLTPLDIGYSHIKERRARRKVPVAAGGTLNDYVPFYFGPRAPMLYSIWRGNVPQYAGRQDEIVHLVVDAERVAERGMVFVYTDGHAVMDLSDFFTNLDEVADHVDFTLMQAKFWNDTDEHPDRSRRRQAEFLVHGSVPWEMVERVGVMSESVRSQMETVLEGAAHRPSVDVRREWYY